MSIALPSSCVNCSASSFTVSERGQVTCRNCGLYFQVGIPEKFLRTDTTSQHSDYASPERDDEVGLKAEVHMFGIVIDPRYRDAHACLKWEDVPDFITWLVQKWAAHNAKARDDDRA